MRKKVQEGELALEENLCNCFSVGASGSADIGVSRVYLFKI